MLWYYTRDILKEDEFLSSLQEKAYLATESTGWEFAFIGLLDVNVYIRLATVGLELGILPRGETICAHTVTQPPGSVFLLPSLMEDWRFRESPYLEMGGLRAYAGAPLRLQTESGDCVGLGTLCVALGQSKEPLTKPQHQALVCLADWVVSDLVQCARVRRQRERRQMFELLSLAQREMDDVTSEEPVLGILRTTYPSAVISLQSSKATHVEAEGRDPISISDFENGLWEDTDFFDEFIANSNHLPLPCTKTARIITSPCDGVSGPSLLVVASKFITLLPGRSVDLISSHIGRGSHFRATVGDFDCVVSTPVTQSLASKLNTLPSSFYTIVTGSGPASLCDYFTHFLTDNGFTPSKNLEDCFIILDAVPDLERHCTHLSRIPTEQVAVCLIPASEGEARLEQTANNVVYVGGPFSALTMCPALEKAQALLLEIRASPRRSLQEKETLSTLSYIYQGLNIDNEISSRTDSVDLGSDVTVPPTIQSHAPTSVELTLSSLDFPVIQSSPKPAALIVDDNAVNLRVMEMYCTKRKLPFYSATDGRQAVEIFSQRQSLSAAGNGASPIQLIFMDLQMPVCNGIEATKQIRSLEQQNKWGSSFIFVMTGQDSATDRTAAEEAGADEYFAKPVIIKQLDRTVKRYIPAFEVS